MIILSEIVLILKLVKLNKTSQDISLARIKLPHM